MAGDDALRSPSGPTGTSPVSLIDAECLSLISMDAESSSPLVYSGAPPSSPGDDADERVLALPAFPCFS